MISMPVPGLLIRRALGRLSYDSDRRGTRGRTSPETRMPNTPGPTESNAPPHHSTRIITVKESRLTLADLLDDLLWPKLLRAPALGIQPTRIGIALFTLVIVGLIGGVNAWFSDEPPFYQAIGSLILPPIAVTEYSESTLVDAIGRVAAVVADHPYELIFQGVPMLAVLALGWGVIARMAAAEFSGGVRMSWPQGLAFVLGRWPSVLGAALGAPALVGLVCLVLAIAGWAVMQIPVVDVIGAVLFPIAIVLALLATLLTLGLVVGGHMLVPAIACEGTDAIDALQRTYAYVIARPARLVIYTLILLALLAVTAVVLGSIATGVESVARDATSVWMSERSAIIFASAPVRPPTGTRAMAAHIVGFWIGLVWLIAGAATLSVFACGSAVLYLLMRQVCDGQDWGELWFPENTEAGRDEITMGAEGSSVRTMASGPRDGADA